MFVFVAVAFGGRALAEPPGDFDTKLASDALDRGGFREVIRSADAALQRDPKSFPALFFRARAHEGLRDYSASIADFTRLIEIDGNRAFSRSIRADDRRGDAYLKAGRVKEAIADFDAYLKREPKVEPYHWRRGIAFYYAGEFQRGVAQFELHKSVNGSDVENSVWHFMCSARLVGVEKAAAALLPLDHDDKRVPMMRVFDLFAGTARTADVLKAAERIDAAGQSESPAFYAHLYVGLFLEANGKPKDAARHIRIAAFDHTSPHYMGDVARLHVKLRKWGPRAEVGADSK